MQDMNINAKFTTKLSLKDIEEYQKFIKKYSDQLPKVAENILTRVSNVGLKDNYKSTEIIPTENNGNTVIGGIRTTDAKDTYKEFGTGIVGSRNPHISEILAQVGNMMLMNTEKRVGYIQKEMVLMDGQKVYQHRKNFTMQ